MPKYLLGLGIVVSMVLAGADPFLIESQSVLLPKIMALSPDAVDRLRGGNGLLAVVSLDGQARLARSVADRINRSYAGRIGSLAFHAEAGDTPAAWHSANIAMIYVLDGSDDEVKKLAQWAVERHIPLFSADPAALHLGVLMSMTMERSVVIVVNRSVLQTGSFRFADPLYSIIRLVDAPSL